MAAPLPRQDSSGCLPLIADIPPEDLLNYIQPALQEYQAKCRTLLETHMNLIKSQYETGLAKASREGDFHLGDLSDINPMDTPSHGESTELSPAQVAEPEPEATSYAATARAAFSPSRQPFRPSRQPFSVADIAKSDLPSQRRRDDAGPTPTRGNEPTIKEVVNPINKEITKSSKTLEDRFFKLGRQLTQAIWDRAAVPLSKRQSSTVADTTKTDPEITAALRKHKRVYAQLTDDLSKVYAAAAETSARVQRSMQVVQELSIKVGTKGDLDEAAHDALDEIRSRADPATLSGPELEAYNDAVRTAENAAARTRAESDEMTKRLEAAQKKQTAQEFVQKSYISSQLTALKSILSIKEVDSADHKSKIAQPVSLVTNLKSLLGDLDPSKLITQPGPMNAERLKDLITALLHTCPVGMSAIAGPLHQAMEQSGFQHLKAAPACLFTSGFEYDHPNRMKDPVTSKWTREYFDRYISQSKETFTLLSRHLHDALTWCDRTCPLSSTNKHRACEGDVVSAIFIILDLNEKSGWTERNAKREFYAHAHTIIGSEKSLRNALAIIRKTLAEAKRIRVKIEYEVVRRVATMIQRREPTLINVTQKYNIEPTGTNAQFQYDALSKLEELLAEADYECEKLGVMTDLSVNYCTDQQLSELHAHAVKAYGTSWNSINDSGSGKTNQNSTDSPSQLICAAADCNNKLSKAADKSARAMAEKHGFDVSKHKHLCTIHFKQTVKDKLDGGKGQIKLKSGKMYTLPTKTKAYKAMKTTILAAQVDTEPAPAPAPAPAPTANECTPPVASDSPPVPPASISIEMTPDEYFAYRSAKESASSQ